VQFCQHAGGEFILLNLKLHEKKHWQNHWEECAIEVRPEGSRIFLKYDVALFRVGRLLV